MFASGTQKGKRNAHHATTPADLARKVFLTKHNLQLVPGVIEWLEELVGHFSLTEEEEIIDTFEHLVKGCQGSGSGLGQFKSSPRCRRVACLRIRGGTHS